MAYTAGAVVRARDLRDGYPLLGYTPADIAVNQTIDWEVVPGLTLICAPSTFYALDGYLAFDAGATPDIRLGMTAPPNAVGRWSVQCLGPAVTTGVGDAQSASSPAFGTAATGTTGGSSAASGVLYGMLRGFLQTGLDGGSLQMIYTQGTADASFVSFRAGSWMTLTKMGDA